MADIDIFMHAIRIQESGDNYAAYNSGSGAGGAYQFIPSTWRYALQQAGLGGQISHYPQAVFAPSWLQDAAAKSLMTRYYNEFSHSYYNVAEAWYGGPGAVGHPGIGGGTGYPSVGGYASYVMAIYGRLGGGVGGTGNGGGSAPITSTGGATDRRVEIASNLLENYIPGDLALIQALSVKPS